MLFIVCVFYEKPFLEYGNYSYTVVEEAVAIDDSEEETLHCSVRGYHVYSYVNHNYGE